MAELDALRAALNAWRGNPADAAWIEVAERLKTAEALITELRWDLAGTEDQLGCREEREDDSVAWDAAQALHREAHDRWPLVVCGQPSCLALKDALRPDWRENRPSLAG